MVDLRRRLRGLAMRAAAAVPWPLWTPAVAAVGLVLAVRPSRPLRQWRANVAALTGRQPNRRDTFAAVWSWARNLVESLQLGRWDAAQLRRRAWLTTADEQRLRTVAQSPGAVIGLPHMGSWDLAGAWACSVGMPVSTVAEQLHAEEFELFLRVRRDLGFSVHGHREPQVLRSLIDESQQGRLVCLLADRDFSRRGIPVRWPTPAGSIEATMPSGPAEVALRAGKTLLGIACHYRGGGMQLVVSEPITASPGADHQTAVAELTQGLCTFFAEQICDSPHDWHLLQPIFSKQRVR